MALHLVIFPSEQDLHGAAQLLQGMEMAGSHCWKVGGACKQKEKTAENKES